MASCGLGVATQAFTIFHLEWMAVARDEKRCDHGPCIIVRDSDFQAMGETNRTVSLATLQTSLIEKEGILRVAPSPFRSLNDELGELVLCDIASIGEESRERRAEHNTSLHRRHASPHGGTSLQALTQRGL